MSTTAIDARASNGKKILSNALRAWNEVVGHKDKLANDDDEDDDDDDDDRDEDDEDAATNWRCDVQDVRKVKN